jgi:hypothetical protein
MGSLAVKKLFLIFSSSVLAALLVGCGGGQAANLQIQLTPSAPTLAVNSSVVITAQTTPPISGASSSLTWNVVGYSGQCTESETYPETAPPIPGCNNGYIAYQIGTGAPITSVYYYSPSTTGTYQINVTGQIIGGSGQVTNQGNITATVTVTNVTPQ